MNAHARSHMQDTWTVANLRWYHHRGVEPAVLPDSGACRANADWNTRPMLSADDPVGIDDVWRRTSKRMMNAASA